MVPWNPQVVLDIPTDVNTLPPPKPPSKCQREGQYWISMIEEMKGPERERDEKKREREEKGREQRRKQAGKGRK